MGAHIFVTGEENFHKCLVYGVYGDRKTDPGPKSASDDSVIIARMESVKRDDFVFIYVANKGVYGLWKATSPAFFDPKIGVWGTPVKYPYVVTFAPVMRAFPKPIALNDIRDLRDKGRVWTFNLSPTVNRRNHYVITTEEARELVRLLLRNNPIESPPDRIQYPYTAKPTPLPLSLATDNKGQLRYEGYLSAWLMRQFAQGKLKDLIGEYQDFLNFVPTSFDKEMDIFLTHVTNVDGIAVLHKFTCIELKTPEATERDLRQLIQYEDWIARKLADGDHQMVQSILVASDFRREVKEYVRKRKDIDEKTVRLVRYTVNKAGTDIQLRDIPLKEEVVE